MKKFQLLFILLISTFILSKCTMGTEEEDLSLILDGKLDNYYSNVANEFEVTGTITVQMTEEEYSDVATRNDIISRRLTAFGLYLTTYVTEKFYGHDTNGNGKIDDDEIFFRNDGYGEFHAMVRNYTVEAIEVVGDAQTGYQVRFSIDIAGPQDLMRDIPRVDTETCDFCFDVKMPKGATIDPDNVPRKEMRNFNPETYNGEIETIRCSAKPYPTITNAYPQYAAFVSDGVYDITLFFGHDYNTARSDLEGARDAFDTLEDLGFTPPVRRFEDLKSDSGPFVRQAKAGGKDIRIEVRIFHSNMFIDSRRAQHNLALQELVTRDVFFYNGHAGPYYGFYLDENEQARVYLDEFATADFTEKQQLFIAQGCQTYSQYADMLYANPLKSEENLDVITTVNFSYGQGTMRLLSNLLKLDRNGNLVPVDFYTIIADLNDEWINYEKMVFYGVTGLDMNPQIHPYANLEKIGQECEKAVECGDTTGNVCVVNPDHVRRCAAVTLGDRCPEGTTFYYVASGNTVKNGVCVSVQPVVKEGDVIINEVLADPPTKNGDANGDGYNNYVQDEFIELYNAGDQAEDISGWQIYDNVVSRFTFPEGTILQPGKAVVVFGGGSVSNFGDMGGSLVFVATKGLQLNNSGDKIILYNNEGNVIETFEFTKQMANDSGMVRAEDGNKESQFVRHPGNPPFTPGKRQNGTNF